MSCFYQERFTLFCCVHTYQQWDLLDLPPFLRNGLRYVRTRRISVKPIYMRSCNGFHSHESPNPPSGRVGDIVAMFQIKFLGIVYYNNIEIPIDRNSEAFKLITRIQDEAHRFAIEFHRSLRSKKQVKSILDDIPGVGPARRKALMQHFKSIDNIKEASLENLEQAPSMTKNIAKSVYDFFH